MKLPWSEKSKDKVDQQQNKSNPKEANKNDKKVQNPNLEDSIINCEGKKYSYNSLPEDSKKLVDNIKRVDKTIQTQKDYLYSIATGRNEYCRQLKNKLKSIDHLS